MCSDECVSETTNNIGQTEYITIQIKILVFLESPPSISSLPSHMRNRRCVFLSGHHTTFPLMVGTYLTQPADFDKLGSNGLGAFGSCPIPDVNFLFIFYFLTGPKGDNDDC